MKYYLKRMVIYPLFIFSLGNFFITGCKAPTNTSSSALEAGFITPPDSAKPRVWWHWMNGNITKQGIKADLEWMKRVNIGGFQNFDAALMTPQIVEKRLVYMTPEWKDAFKFTTKLADSLGLEMAIAGSPGWSESGGPWVKPEQAMKKLVWSEIRVDGGKPFSGILPQPPTATGPFQDLAIEERSSLTGVEAVPAPKYYAEAAVVAFQIPENDIPLTGLQPNVTSSGGKFTAQMLTDGDLSSTTLLPYQKPGEYVWIQYEFSKPETFQSVSIAGGLNSGVFGGAGNPEDRILEVSNDGKIFQKVTSVPTNRIGQVTLAFAPVTGKFFRYKVITPAPLPDLMSAMFGGPRRATQGPTGTKIAEFNLFKAARINRFEEKAGFGVAVKLAPPVLASAKGDVIEKSTIVDLTAMMKADGTLNWTPPSGNWKIMRFGYTLTGHKNSPASPEATGLEVDKLSAEHVKAYFTNYLDQYKDATGGLMGKKGLQYMITDSWEAGTQNWTNTMAADFKAKRGYNLISWLPAMAGYVIGNTEETERFLWDIRKTIGDLTTENHYDQLTDILKERGMARYTESHEDGRAFIGDGMEVKRKSAIPMSATWTPRPDENTIQTRFKADVRESASVAHIYGQKFVAAESMTAIASAWQWSPETLKLTADMELASGLNRFVIHTSVHQPVNDKIPGLGLGPFGQWFTRHETWAEQAGVWMTYLARNSYMLQQGKFVADIIYYYGEDNNITALFGEKMPDIPEGYNYDFVNADALVNVLSVNNHSITTPGGTDYRLLVLDENSRNMTLKVLRKIHDLVNEGAIVCGEKPFQTPSLSDDPAEFKKLADELWANPEGENTVGKGKVYGGKSFAEVLKVLNILPDFQYSKLQEDSELLYVHRKLDDIDIYWVNNRMNRVEELSANFRTIGKTAEIWHPETGKIEQVSYSIADGTTKVPLHLQPNDAVFVVFRNKAKSNSETIVKPIEKELARIEGPWNIAFQSERGAPATATFDALTAWNENADNGIKYFSGTGSYTKTIQVSADWLKEGSQIWLDLGTVKNVAEVIVNGQSVGTVWKTPFRIEMTKALKQGENSLEIKVTNLWVNRLIGDQQPEAKTKIT